MHWKQHKQMCKLHKDQTKSSSNHLQFRTIQDEDAEDYKKMLRSARLAHIVDLENVNYSFFTDQSRGLTHYLVTWDKKSQSPSGKIVLLGLESPGYNICLGGQNFIFLPRNSALTMEFLIKAQHEAHLSSIGISMPWKNEDPIVYGGMEEMKYFHKMSSVFK